MKRLVPLLLALAASTVLHAQSGGMKGMDMKDMQMKMDEKATKGAVHNASGVVTEVDDAKSELTIKHEPVQSLNWPAMTMRFSVAEPALLERLAPGRKVAFEFVSDAGAYRIVNVISLGQADAPSAQGSRGGMHGGMHGGMMGDMASMREMCESMMGGKQR